MTEVKIDIPFHHKILSNLKEAILFIQTNGNIIKGNNAAFSLLAIDDTKQLSIYNYLDFDLLNKNDKSHLLMEQKNNHQQLIEVKSVRVSDSVYCLIMNKLSLQDKSNEVKKYMSQLIQTGVEGTVMYAENQIIDCDPSFATLFGYTQQEIKQLKMNELLDSRSAEKLTEIIQKSPEKLYDLTAIRKDGTSFFMEIMEHPYNNQGNIIRVAIIKDITDKVENEKHIEYLAYYDELTDLPNQHFFNKILKEAIDEASKAEELLAVYFIDLNYFKEINDTMGYAFGDKLLKACSIKLKTFLQTDTFVARMGGDEFLILKRNIPNKDVAISLAESLITEFKNPIKMDGYDIYTSISIGISVFPDNGKTAQDLIKHADSAMYVIKEAHRNNYKLFDSSISESFKSMLTMESELRKAIKEGQFELHYQPQKSLSTGKIVGMEALLRWKHPLKGNIPPLDFIPLAEKTGLIIEIGDWVIHEACRQNKEWQDKGYEPLVVGVNLSAKQFHQKKLVQKIEETLNRTGLSPEYLELELTESMSMTNEQYILSSMKQLRMLGVLVSIDDFGTGYSSLKYLGIFPITRLKIDKMFMDGKYKHQAIVKSIIHMSHSLDMKVIAEGVETIEQLSFLESEKCDEMQGFYFSKPLPPKQLVKLLSFVS